VSGGPLKRGANVALTREVPSLKTAVLGVRWNAGSEKALDENLVTAAMLVGTDGRVNNGDDFVFFNQLTAAAGSVQHVQQLLGDDREQIEVDLADVPASVEKVVVALYVNEGAPVRRTLGQLKACTVRVLDANGNAELVRSEDLAPALSAETALVLGELYRHQGGWKFRVVGQVYATGLRGVADDYGVPL
jgi:tellurium resistance protein TerD